MEREEAAGCVGMRRISPSICEMKRLYVRKAYRGRGVGRRLSAQIIARARERGYSAIRLDTIISMREANKLYSSLGFQKTRPYRFNPIDGAVFMELKLS